MTGWAAVFLAAAGGLLVVASGLIVRADRRTGRAPAGPSEAGYLRDRERGALTVALAALHLRGTVDAGRGGTLRIHGPMEGIGEPLQRAICFSLDRPVGYRALAARPRVARELANLRRRLADDGLLRGNGEWRAARGCLYAAAATVVAGLMLAPFGGPNSTAQHTGSGFVLIAAALLWKVPRPTRAGRRALAELRERFPLPAEADGAVTARRQTWTAETALLRVGLYGRPALIATAPHFARASGLLTRGRGAGEALGSEHQPAPGGPGYGG